MSDATEVCEACGVNPEEAICAKCGTPICKQCDHGTYQPTCPTCDAATPRGPREARDVPGQLTMEAPRE